MESVYIVNTNKVMEKNFNAEDLVQANFDFNSPFQLLLKDGQLITANAVARIMPGRRMVVFGQWNNRPIVAKLFFDSRDAVRHMRADLRGIEVLKEKKIPTPELLYQGVSDDNKVQVLVFRHITEAESLFDLWQARRDADDIVSIFQQVVLEIAIQHVLGVVQQDLHLKNFLVTEKIVYTLDGAQVKCFPCKVPQKESIENLALFLSQLSVGYESLQLYLFRFYAKSRGWLVREEDIGTFKHLIHRWDDERWKKFAKKIRRNATDYQEISTCRKTGMLNRHFSGKQMHQFIKNPEEIFTAEETVVLKAGNSSTVIRVKLDGKDLVIKRYNLKNIKHRLRRCLRQTRAFRSWHLAHKILFFGLHTAKPVAYLENRFLCFRGKSYFVMENVEGQLASKYFANHESEEDSTAAVMRRIAVMLKNLFRLELTHGDLKLTNIIINREMQPIIVDLDGAAEHRSVSGLRAAWGNEISRFLQNFNDQPALKNKFKKLLVL